VPQLRLKRRVGVVESMLGLQLPQQLPVVVVGDMQGQQRLLRLRVVVGIVGPGLLQLRKLKLPVVAVVVVPERQLQQWPRVGVVDAKSLRIAVVAQKVSELPGLLGGAPSELTASIRCGRSTTSASRSGFVFVRIAATKLRAVAGVISAVVGRVLQRWRRVVATTEVVVDRAM
jgi:hypothetical protein